MEVRAANDLARGFERTTKARANALTMTADPTGLFVANQKQIVELAAKKRLPAIYTSSTHVNAGGLMSYAPNELENYRRAATYVDKILKGAKPGIYP
jgi:putative tryptophan/tyrosine transport system substrate-binding protein